MKKIPSLFVRDWDGNSDYVTREIDPECGWVFTDPGVRALRKWDGTCVMYDGRQWWARREVKLGKTPPPDFVEISTDDVTAKVMGWIPADQSGFVKYLVEATGSRAPRWEPGTYELCGPRINGNPEKLPNHQLIRHSGAGLISGHLAMTNYDEIREVVLSLRRSDGIEGIVWHHPDGRMCKIKARDFAPVEQCAGADAMSGDYETIPYAGGHIDVGYTSHKRIQRINSVVTVTPVYDRAYLRIHAAGDDGFLAAEMTPADVYALLKAVQRYCPHVEDQDMVRIEDEGLIRQATTLKPGDTLIVRVSENFRPSQVRDYQEHLEAHIDHAGLDLRVLVVLGDELAVQRAEETPQ